MNQIYEFIKEYFLAGLYTLENLDTLVKGKMISEEEKEKLITSKNE